MKVNVTYSVELDEVLNEVLYLYCRQKNTLQTKLDEAHKILSNRYEDQKLGEVLASLQHQRAALAMFDLKLEEIHNILLGYQKIKVQLNNPAPESVEEEAEEEIEIE